VVGKHEGVSIGLVLEHEDLVGAVAALGFAAVEHWVLEVADMAGSFPYARMHDDRAVEPDNVLAQLGHGFPPAGLDVALHLNAERAVVPEAVDAAVDFRSLENKTTPLAQAGKGVHRYVVVVCFHKTGENAEAG